MALSNVAETYGKLGRHDDALAMQERVLLYYHRVLPENHLGIGEVHVRSDALHVLC